MNAYGKNVPCPNGGKCGSASHKPGLGPLRICTMLSQKSSAGAPKSRSHFSPMAIKGPDIREGNFESRGPGTYNRLVSSGTLKFSGGSTFAAECHSEGVLTVSSGAEAYHVSSDFYIVLRESGHVSIHPDARGQVVIAASRYGPDGTPSYQVLDKLETQPEYTFVWDARTKKWGDREFDDQYAFLEFIEPWRELNRLDYKDPRWVSADNFGLINFASPAPGEPIQEEALTAGLIIFPNSER